MGLMDKVKKASEQAVAKAQEGVKEGRAKLDEVQAKRQWDALLRNLGAAVYAEQRQSGPYEAVTTALQELDDYTSAHGAGETDAQSSNAQSGDAHSSDAQSTGAPADGPGQGEAQA